MQKTEQARSRLEYVVTYTAQTVLTRSLQIGLLQNLESIQSLVPNNILKKIGKNLETGATGINWYFEEKQKISKDILPPTIKDLP